MEGWCAKNIASSVIARAPLDAARSGILIAALIAAGVGIALVLAGLYGTPSQMMSGAGQGTRVPVAAQQPTDTPAFIYLPLQGGAGAAGPPGLARPRTRPQGDAVARQGPGRTRCSRPKGILGPGGDWVPGRSGHARLAQADCCPGAGSGRFPRRKWLALSNHAGGRGQPPRGFRASTPSRRVRLDTLDRVRRGLAGLYHEGKKMAGEPAPVVPSGDQAGLW